MIVRCSALGWVSKPVSLMGPYLSRRSGVPIASPATALSSCRLGPESLGVGDGHPVDPSCPFSLPFYLSSGNSSKKPTREWEPLSEPKVKPACLHSSLCRGPGRGSRRARASPPAGLASCCARARLGPLGPGWKRRHPGAWARWRAVHVSWGCGCMALHPECL